MYREYVTVCIEPENLCVCVCVFGGGGGGGGGGLAVCGSYCHTSGDTVQKRFSMV